MIWANFYIYSVWAMAFLNLVTGIGCFMNAKPAHGGMFLSYAVACIFIIYQIK